MKKSVNIFATLKPYKWLIGLLVILTAISNGLSLLLPKFIASGIDTYRQGSFDMVGLLTKFLIVITLVFIFSYLQSLLQIYTSEKAARDLRQKLITAVSERSFSYVQSVTPARILTNLTSDVDAVKQFISMGVANIISSVFLIIGASTLLILTNWKLALAVMAIIPFIGILFFLIMGRIRPLFKKTQTIIDQLNRIINESILGAALVRVLNSREQEKQKFGSINTEARNNGLKILGYFATLIPSINFIAVLATIVILVLGGHYIILGTMSLGDLTAFNTYVMILIFPIIMLGFTSNIIARSSASYERVVSLLEQKNEKENGTLIKEIKGGIELDKVSVKYGEKYALKNVSFKIKAGTKTAIIGPTAAGKSQLLYLLSGLIDPEKGVISYDGKNLNEYDRQSLHQQLGYVFQDSIIFNMSLRENISFSKTVSDLELTKAVKTAELGDFVNNLPQKLDTIVSERGGTLSGGQKQRVMLARALALNPKVLLLDDFTARVDTKTEEKILHNIEKEYPDITLVSVTQKISAVTDYDQIILLMEGELIDSGTHQHLLKTCPEYVQLFESQRSTSHYELSTQQ